MTAPSGFLEQLDRRQRLLITLAAMVVIAAGIRASASLLDSLLLALLLTVAVMPGFDSLRQRGISKGVAITVTTVMLLGIALALLAFLAVAGTQLVRMIPVYQPRVEGLRESLIAALSRFDVAPEQVLPIDLINPSRVLGLAAGFLSGAGKVLSKAVLLVLIVSFILVETGPRIGALRAGSRIDLMSRDVRQYLVITSATGLVFSLACYILMLSLGTDLALVWAVMAFVMNFVPSVGIVLSLVPPALLTLLEYGWGRAVTLLVGFLVMNFIIDNLIKPRYMQSGLDVSPLIGLLSLVIWSFLLGPTGALLAIPLTIALRRLLQDPVPPAPIVVVTPAPPPEPESAAAI